MQKRKWGFIDATGKLVIAHCNTMRHALFKGGLCAVAKGKKKMGYY